MHRSKNDISSQRSIFSEDKCTKGVSFNGSIMWDRLNEMSKNKAKKLWGALDQSHFAKPYSRLQVKIKRKAE